MIPTRQIPGIERGLQNHGMPADVALQIDDHMLRQLDQSLLDLLSFGADGPLEQQPEQCQEREEGTRRGPMSLAFTTIF